MEKKDFLSDRYAVLKIRDFRLALAVRLFDGLATQMLTVAVGWQIYELTRDPLLLGFLGLAGGLPYIGIALWAGQVVDRGEKSAIIASAEAWTFLGAFGFLLLALMHKPPLTLIYALVACGSACRSFQWTALITYMQTVVPTEMFPKAAAWYTSMWHIATIAGPVIGGLIYGFHGAAAAYGAAALCVLAAFFLTLRMNTLPVAAIDHKSSGLEDFLSGIRFVFSRQAILAAMSVDMFGMLFGGVDGVLPIFAGVLGVGATGLGLMRAAPAVGALICALYLAHHQPFQKMGAASLASLAAFGLCMIAFAFSQRFWLSLLILLASGVVDGISMVMRSSIYQALTPDHLRGRVASVNGIFIRSSNQIGAFESGLAAKLMGLAPSVVFGGCMTLASVAVAVWTAPQLRRLRI